MRTRATIIETTKQDELDEVRHVTKQEIASLNHIISKCHMSHVSHANDRQLKR